MREGRADSAKTKTVYFIRHGESDSNVRFKLVIDSFRELFSFSDLSLFKLATFWGALIQLITEFDSDSALSPLGEKQALSVGQYASKAFADHISSDITDIRFFHSNLSRAKQTAKLALSSSFSEAKELDLLQEASLFEHIFSSSLNKRIQEFEKHLASVEESTVVVFGHAQYFKKLLNNNEYTCNCDVWSSVASVSQDGAVSWDSPVLQFRSQFSYPHPINSFFSRIESDVQNNNLETSVSAVSDDASLEITCRICQMTADESSPDDKFIKPCKCSGTLAYVHISCLNEWRTTSMSASYKCYVCKYSYRIERTALSRFLMSDNGTAFISCLLIAIATVSLGIGFIMLARLFGMDVAGEICRLLQWRAWWRDCSFHRLPAKVSSVLSTLTSPLLGVDIDHLQAMFLCHARTVLLVEVLLVGCASIGAIGLAMFVVFEGIALCENIGRGVYDAHYLVLTSCWLASLGSTNLSRFAVWLGYAVSCRCLYSNITVIGKRVAQAIGERILEPHDV